ncbi:MAG: hypothetical protein K6T29_00015 [Peptococcaceae bacterium]|nr:hypothetical protein [Peptococcaceae bacterium]
MAGGIVIGLVILLLAALSVRERVRLRLLREKDWSTIGEPRASPLSQALANLVGVAGGIYLSLVLAVTFLELQMPERVEVCGYSLEPLAAASILAALVQPYLQRVINAWRRI